MWGSLSRPRIKKVTCRCTRVPRRNFWLSTTCRSPSTGTVSSRGGRAVPLDYYPHEGDPVTPLGFTASNGEVYRSGRIGIVGVEPTMYVTRQNYPSFSTRKPNKIWLRDLR